MRRISSAMKVSTAAMVGLFGGSEKSAKKPDVAKTADHSTFRKPATNLAIAFFREN
jgi:hypothetical protein